MHCWNAGLRIPLVDDCPECSIIQGKQFPYKRQYDDGRGQQSIHVDRPERRCTPVHDRLGKKIDPLEQLEEEANACVPDERPLVREIEYRYDDPYQWCPGGLTRSQKI